jgi:hypothetical protein
MKIMGFKENNFKIGREKYFCLLNKIVDLKILLVIFVKKNSVRRNYFIFSL